ncbi:MAG: HTH-type transcriptional regulator RutR [Proteobacteria bacterium]|nr:HTH-type transcriptional regulator RutR [Pseudomonadota bacterium]
MQSASPKTAALRGNLPLSDAEPAQGRAMTATGEANVERILDAALAHFARLGFQGARIDAIARDSGLSKPNLLYYFRTKNDLYLAVLRRTLDMWLEPLRSLDAAIDPRIALGDYITRKLEYSRDHPEASRLFALEIMQGAPILSSVLESELRALIDMKTGLIESWIAMGRVRDIPPHHLVFMIWAVTQHYADFSSQVAKLTGKNLADPRFFAETREAVLRLILDGAMTAP